MNKAVLVPALVPKPIVNYSANCYGAAKVLRSEFLNGIRVAATKPHGAQLASCTIMFQAGSRMECDNELGATHFLRAASNCTGCGHSGFMKIRFLQEFGGYITCSSDRQNIAYTLRCPQPVFCHLKCYLIDTATRGLFREHELEDKVRPMVLDDLSRQHPEQLVLDLVQKACWTGPLHNSVYCAPGRVDSIDEQTLVNFTRKCFTTNVCSVGSYGLPFEDTLKLAEHIDCGKVERPIDIVQPKSLPRGGFEYVDLGPGATTWIAVAVPGCGTKDVNVLMKHALLANTLGVGNMFDGTHPCNNILQTPLGCLSSMCYTNFKAFNISYYENGVFGIIVRTKPRMAEKAAVAAVQFLTNLGNLSWDQVDAGKQRLKVEVASSEEHCTNVSEALALQSAYCHKLDPGSSILHLIDRIGIDVANVGAEISKKCACCMSIAVVGDVNMVPDFGTLLDCR